MTEKICPECGAPTRQRSGLHPRCELTRSKRKLPHVPGDGADLGEFTSTVDLGMVTPTDLGPDVGTPVPKRRRSQ